MYIYKSVGWAGVVRLVARGAGLAGALCLLGWRASGRAGLAGWLAWTSYFAT